MSHRENRQSQIDATARTTSLFRTDENAIIGPRAGNLAGPVAQEVSAKSREAGGEADKSHAGIVPSICLRPVRHRAANFSTPAAGGVYDRFRSQPVA